MRPEIEYQMWVKQPMDQVMNQVEEDSKHFGIEADELNRAVLNWVLERMQQGEVPDWFLKDLKPE